MVSESKLELKPKGRDWPDVNARNSGGRSSVTPDRLNSSCETVVEGTLFVEVVLLVASRTEEMREQEE